MASVLVVGSGLAGLLAAVRATDAGHRVTLVTKGALPESNTLYAQGGIAAALFPDDSTEAHIEDTLRAGAGLNDPEAVRVLCTEGPGRVRDLIRFGVDFDHDESGLRRGLEAAHSRSRVLHAGGDATGAAIETALVATVRRRGTRPGPLRAGSLRIREHSMLADLVVEHGRVAGALVAGSDGVCRLVDADTVILATGGAGALYRYTTNPHVATGDGVAAAWRAGAAVADLEFYQFHPTALAVPGTPLVSEAVRGEGAVLRNRRGERFMLAVHPDAELAPRDVVARAIATEMAAQGGEPVRLDATSLPRSTLESRFPTITAACQAAGLDWADTPVPVAPAAHYWMGGVVTDLWGRSTLPGLFAVGEVARTGAHGANRLASNSLLEAAVFADRAVRALDADGWPPAQVTPHSRAAGHGAAGHGAAGLRAAGHGAVIEPVVSPATTFVRRDRLADVMWEHAGVHRFGDGLRMASAALGGWHGVDPAADGPSVAEREDANLLLLARLTVAAALAREESRGAHHRDDFPHADPSLAQSVTWARHSLYSAEEAFAC
ncbi:L-aspartate oxidase [Glaciibacter psychrotolerans]|uniref:L-aspartate oxidase n=1 Tax=Glaciibacter psychrotolerans TaxID=670054 RepID=A0A7Z0J5Q8_9MICO|nr:L-aspartate oxidase [Leifsonia psychrotolerans]NYJ19670.1 L-aspartate oxidase [Leifsonia psychrotolerans]